MTTITETSVTTQVYRVYIRATPEAIWDAITTPEWTEKFGYGGRAEYDLRPGGKYRGTTSEAMRTMGAPDVAIDGEVIEADPPRKLVQTWRMVMDPDLAAEGFTRLTYEIEPMAPIPSLANDRPVTKLTVTHDLRGAPKLAVLVGGAAEDTGAGGGWNWVLSGLKTLVETGEPLNS